MKQLLIATLFAVSAFAVCFTRPSAATADNEERVIRVATPGDYVPFTIYDEASQEWSGFDVELWQTIGERSGYKIEFVRFAIPASFAEMDLGRVDTVAQQVSVTPTRQQKYDFTQPYFFSPYCLTVLESNEEIKSWKDMEGKSIAVPEGGSELEFVVAMDPENKVKKLVYEAGSSFVQEVAMGRADACPYAYLVLPYRLKRNPELKLKAVDIENPIFTEVNAYPFARTDRGRELLKLTDDVLTQMFQDGSYAKLCEKWFGVNVMETGPAKEYREKQAK